MLALIQNLAEEALHSMKGESTRCVARLLGVLAGNSYSWVEPSITGSVGMINLE